MNTEAKPEDTVNETTGQSIGQRLTAAREALGMSQQQVATRLCLKLSTVKEIERDIAPSGLAVTFLRGYIRSYGRLVHISEHELLPDLAESAAVNTSKITPVRSYSTFGNRRSKRRREHILMLITLLIFLILAGLTFSWWWQNHQSSQEELTKLGNQSNLVSNEGDDSSPAFPNAAGGSSAAENSDSVMKDQQLSTAQEAQQAPSENVTLSSTDASKQDATDSTAAAPVASSSGTENSRGEVNPTETPDAKTMNTTSSSQASVGALPLAPAKTSSAETKTLDASLQLAFRSDCWVEIFDANDKKLASGIQRRGARLDLVGKLPYRLRIGAPAAVDVQFRKQPVDLSSFIRNKQIARLTLGKE